MYKAVGQISTEFYWMYIHSAHVVLAQAKLDTKAKKATLGNAFLWLIHFSISNTSMCVLPVWQATMFLISVLIFKCAYSLASWVKK